MSLPHFYHADLSHPPLPTCADETAVIALWQRCGLTRRWNNPKLDIERKLQVNRDSLEKMIDSGTGDT